MNAPASADALTDEDIRALLPEHPEGPGCAVAVLRRGEVERVFLHGHASVEHRVPIGPQTVFRVASVTKQFLCAGLLALADEGRLDLDSPLIEHLPAMHPVPGAATLRQAMTNTSGIRDHLELWYVSGGGLQAPHRLRDSLALAMRQSGTNFPPGSRYLYSNANFLLLTAVLERVTGEAVADFLDRRFFRPLGMTRTRLRAGHHDVIEDLASGYVVKPGGRLERGRMTAEIWGEGSAHSCLDDLARWLRWYREDPEGLVARMRVPERFANGAAGFYGLGLFVDPWRGARRVGHSGLWPGYLTEIVWYDEADLAFICLSNCNALEPALINKRLAERLVPGLEPAPAPEALDAAAWAAAREGEPWINPESLDVAALSEGDDGAPQLVYYGGEVPLAPTSPTCLALDNGRSEYREIDIARASAGEVALVRANGERVVLGPAARLTGAPALAALAGRWRCADVEGPLIIEVEGDAVRVATPAFKGHDWIATPLPGGLLQIDETTGPWPRRFYLRGLSADALVLSGPRARRLVYARA
jgi:CubicO group peptidase (beta-lactamase class C family)